MSKVAVVVLNYNGKKYLEKFLPGIMDCSKGHEVIIADNCSTDDSLPYLKQYFPNVRRIELTENLGFCGGYNAALKEVNSEYYVILNSDVEVTANWIEPVIEFMDKNENVAACQPKILAYHNKSHFEYAGAAGGYLDFLGYPFCRGRIFFDLEEDKGQYDNNQRVFWATGACLFIKSKVFHELGGFDPDYFAHMEEIDLCWRINRSGKEVYCIGASKVFHVGGGTLSKENPKKTYLNFRNSLATVFKNSTKTSLLWKLPIRLILDSIAALKFFLTDGPKSAYAVIRANAHFYFHIPRYVRKRKISQSHNIIRTPLQHRNSIVIEHYLYGKNKFSELSINR